MRAALGVATAIVLAAGAAPALAADPIEGTWIFNGGEVLVEATGPGTFKGTVVKDTSFSSCTHRAGERMWEIALNDAGEYRGTHRWFNTADCTFKATGRSLWKITSTDPARYELKFCSNPPENPTDPQLTDPGCDTLVRSKPPAPPPTAKDVITFPKSGKRRCVSRRKFTIRLRTPRTDSVVDATVFVNGRRVKVIRGARLRAPVDLRGLPRGRVTVRIEVRLATGRVLRGTRKYRTCTKKRRGGRPRL